MTSRREECSRFLQEEAEGGKFACQQEQDLLLKSSVENRILIKKNGGIV